MHRLMLLLLLVVFNAEAQNLSRLDSNSDGELSGLAFGDSITFGVGDGAGIGYPSRLAGLIGVPVANAGVPGEKLSQNGVARAPSTIAASPADFVILMEGANDAILRVGSGEYERLLQQVINVARVLGREPVLLSLPAPCCDHASLAPYTEAYSAVINSLAAANNLLLADVQRAWQTTCLSAPCELYNLPEGLHPNNLGYDVMAQTIAATILDVDIFAQDGAAQLEAAAGVPAGTVIVKPDPALVTP